MNRPFNGRATSPRAPHRRIGALGEVALPSRPFLKGAAVIALLGLAAYLVWQGFGRAAPGEKAFFYDQSAAKIFLGARTAVAPIRGVDGPEEDAYRALVVSVTGHPQDSSSWQVAYVEKCSPELKKMMETAQASGEPLAMGRLAAQAQRFVRRLTDKDWYPSNSPEGEEVLNGWAKPGPDGVTPVVCSP
ncbi:MAG: hypothetical protein IT581_17465 [Verrucomicrobiales bacterium]|nr:hypothetical protein [Verrucomicrobiales bacterium]